MSFKVFVFLNFFLVLVEGFIAIYLSYGVNGEFYKSSKSNGEAIAKLREAKPTTAKIIGICYGLIVLELVLVIVVKMWR